MARSELSAIYNDNKEQDPNQSFMGIFDNELREYFIKKHTELIGCQSMIAQLHSKINEMIKQQNEIIAELQSKNELLKSAGYLREDGSVKKYYRPRPSKLSKQKTEKQKTKHQNSQVEWKTQNQDQNNRESIWRKNQ